VYSKAGILTSVGCTFLEEGILGIQIGQEMVKGTLGHSPPERRREIDD
jgi:hypothetical protein